MKVLKKIVILSVCLGLVFACIIISIAINHNPQGEFINYSGEVQIINLLTLFASAFLINSVILSIILIAIWGIYRVVQKYIYKYFPMR